MKGGSLLFSSKKPWDIRIGHTGPTIIKIFTRIYYDFPLGSQRPPRAFEKETSDYFFTLFHVPVYHAKMMRVFLLQIL